jgi:hypothetical protein
METTNYEILGKKLHHYFLNKQDIHLKLNNGYVRNGSIKEMGADFIILIDKRVGEIAVFFMEIEEAEPYLEEGK